MNLGWSCCESGAAMTTAMKTAKRKFCEGQRGAGKRQSRARARVRQLEKVERTCVPAWSSDDFQKLKPMNRPAMMLSMSLAVTSAAERGHRQHDVVVAQSEGARRTHKSGRGCSAGRRA